MKRLLLPVLTVAVLFGPAAPAAAAPDGQLKQLALPNGCLDNAGTGGCRDITGPMQNVGEPSISANGRFIYVPARGSNSINVFERNATTGILTERNCRSFDVAGCTAPALGTVTPLQDATATAVYGNHLYVVGGSAGDGGTQAPDGIAHFTLDATTGVPTFATCHNTGGTGACSGAPALANPASVAVSPDGKNVYVASYDSHAIAVFQRNTTTGTLNQTSLSDAQKCLKRDGSESCTPAPVVATPRDIEVTPDGKQVVVANTSFMCCDFFQDWGINVAVFDRDQASGALAVHAGAGGCVAGITSPTSPCQARDFSYGPSQLAITKDGRQIYVTQRILGDANQIQRILRDPVSGNIAPDGGWCAKYPGTGGFCPVESKALSDPFDVALSPNEADIYTSGYNGQRVGVFDRNAAGIATPKPAPLGCVATTQADACGRVLQQGTNIEYVLPSPDGRHVYAMGIDKIFSFAVDHAPRCSSFSVPTSHNLAVTLKLRCTDADGDPLAYQIVSQPAKGQFGALQGDTITYGPLVGTSGPDSFRYRATAAGVTADTATVTVRVAPSPGSIDADGDGAPASTDCDDANRNAHPGAKEIRGNRVDENCDGRTPDFGRINQALKSNWRAFPAFTEVTRLRMSGAPAGAKGQIRCLGSGCEFRKKNVKRRRGTIDFLKALKGSERSFRVGQTVEVRVTAKDYVGRVVRYKIKPRAVPAGQVLCLPVGKARPKRRC